MKTTFTIVLALFALVAASMAALAQPQPPQNEQFNAKTFFEQQSEWGS